MKRISLLTLLFLVVIFSSCARRGLGFLHETDDTHQTILLKSAPDTMEIYIGGRFLGVTPVNTDIWYRADHPIRITAVGMHGDSTYRSLELTYQPFPDAVTFYSGSDLRLRKKPSDFPRKTPIISPEVVKPSVQTDRTPAERITAVADDSIPCVLPLITFDYDSYVLLPDQLQLLDPLKRLLQQTPSLQLEIHGYADERGDDLYNRKLSLGRAGAVLNALVDAGVERTRMVVFGHGEVTAMQYDGYELEYAKSRIVNFQLVDTSADE